MRSLLLFALGLVGCTSALSAQLTIDPKVNVGSAITGGVNVAVEFPLQENMGLSAGFAYSANPFGLDINDDDGNEIKFRNVRFIPEYRYYFSPREGLDRFYVGLYGKFGQLTIKEEDGDELDATRIAAGLLVGHKWVSRGGFIFELNGGFGRGGTVGKGGDDDREFEEAYGVLSRYDLRLGLIVGYRF